MESIEIYRAGIDIHKRLVAHYGDKTERGYPVELGIDFELENKDGLYVLSVCADLTVKKCDKLGLISCECGGQCLDDAAAHLKKCGLRCKALDDIVPIWKEWHINDTHAGTPAQEEAINRYEKEHPDWRYDYTEAREILQECDLLFDKDFLVDGKPYEYGLKWLKREIPDEVIRKLCEIMDCPITIERIKK